MVIFGLVCVLSVVDMVSSVLNMVLSFFMFLFFVGGKEIVMSSVDCGGVVCVLICSYFIIKG